MLITKNQMVHIATLADLGGAASIKKLTHEERKAIKVMMTAMLHNNSEIQISLDKMQFENLTHKLWDGIGAHKTSGSFFLISFFKGLANLLGLRIASKDLARDAQFVSSFAKGKKEIDAKTVED